MDILVSVIIPVYNTEKYLNNCVESVIRQSESCLEIILVDDGSTDSSSVLCDEWTKKDSRVKVIHKANEGLGFTRNAGLNVASGKYISFLDSDDTLDEDTYKNCIAYMENYTAQVCYFGRKSMDKDGVFHEKNKIPEKLFFYGDEIRQEFAKIYFGPLPCEEKDNYIQGSACCVLYERKLIEDNQIRFCSERQYLSEDTFFNLDICKYAECVCILPKNLYNYTYNEVSLTKLYSKTKFMRSKNLYYKLKEYSMFFQDISDVKERITFLFIGYSRGFIRSEILSYKEQGFVNTYHILKDMFSDKDIQTVYAEFPQNLLDRSSKIFVNWVLKKRVVLLMVYYIFIQQRKGKNER